MWPCLSLALLLITVTRSLWLLLVLFLLYGGVAGGFNTGYNLFVSKTWPQENCFQCRQVIVFMNGIGAMIAPLIVDSFHLPIGKNAPADSDTTIDIAQSFYIYAALSIFIAGLSLLSWKLDSSPSSRSQSNAGNVTPQTEQNAHSIGVPQISVNEVILKIAFASSLFLHMGSYYTVPYFLPQFIHELGMPSQLAPKLIFAYFASALVSRSLSLFIIPWMGLGKHFIITNFFIISSCIMMLFLKNLQSEYVLWISILVLSASIASNIACIFGLYEKSREVTAFISTTASISLTAATFVYPLLISNYIDFHYLFLPLLWLGSSILLTFSLIVMHIV